MSYVKVDCCRLNSDAKKLRKLIQVRDVSWKLIIVIKLCNILIVQIMLMHTILKFFFELH